MLHEIGADARPRPPQPRLAVDGKTLVLGGNHSLEGSHHLSQCVHVRAGSIRIDLLVVIHAGVRELSFLVVFLVEADYQTNVFAFEVRDVIVWTERAIAFR